MPHQLRIVAAIAVLSGLTAAGAVFVEERLGLAALQQKSPPDPLTPADQFNLR